MAAARLAALAWPLPASGAPELGAARWRGGGVLSHHARERADRAPPGSGLAAPAATTAATAAAAAACRRRAVRSAAAGGSPAPSASGSQRSSRQQRQPQRHSPPQQQQQQPHRWRRWQQPGGTPQSEQEHAIYSSQSAQQLLGLAERSSDSWTPGCAAAALRQLDRLLRSAPSAERQQAAQHPALPRLYLLLQQGAEGLPSQELVGLLNSCVSLGLRPPAPLLEAVAAQLVRRLPALAPHQACGAARALAKLGSDATQPLLAAIDALVQAQQQELAQQGGQPAQAALPPWLASLQPPALIGLLWACSKARYQPQALLAGIAEALLAWPRSQQQQGPWPSSSAAAPPRRGSGSQPAEPLATLSPQQLSTVFYSLGQLHWVPSEQFLHAAARQAQRHLPDFQTQALANTAHGVARLGRQPVLRPLAAALAAEAAPRLAEFKPQELVMVTVAAAGQLEQWGCGALLAAAGEQMARRAQQLSARDLASMLSALATARHPLPASALDVVAQRLSQLLAPGAGAPVPPAALAWVLWSFGRSGYRPPGALLRRVEAALRRGSCVELYGLEPADVSRLCWGLAELRHYSGGLLADLAAVLRSMWQRTPPQSMAMALHAFATLNFTPHELLDAAAEHMALHLPHYTPQAAAVVAWSFGRLGVHPCRGLPEGGPCTPDGTPLMAALADYALQRIGPQPPPQQQGAAAGEAFGLQGLSMLLWSFATLEQHPGDELLQAVAARFRDALQQHAPATDAPAAAAAAAAAADAAAAKAAGAEAAAGAQQGQQGERASLRAVANVAWSLAKFKHTDEPFFAAVADALPALADAPSSPSAADPGAAAGSADQDQPSEHALAIASLSFAAAKLQAGAAPALLQRLLPAAQRHMGGFGAEEAAQLLWALAHVALPEPPPLALLDAAVARLEAGVATCDPSLLCMAVHALGVLRYRAAAPLLDACVRQVAGPALGDVPVSLLAKLLWGCAHVAHEPEAEALEAILEDLRYRLSHARGNRNVLNVSELVLLLWALAALQQYNCRLYRNAAFRATRLPDGVPAQPRLRRMLREATVLYSAEHRLDPVAADAASALLPVWMAEEQQAQQAQQAQAQAPRATVTQPLAAATAGGGGSGRQDELRLAAVAVCGALQRAGIPARVMQFSFGDYLVLFELRRRGAQAAVVPATPGRMAVNDPRQLLGSALVAARVLAARGVAVVPPTLGEVELLAACAELQQAHQRQRGREGEQEQQSPAAQ